MKKSLKDQLGDFLAGKGFYLVLLLCVAAIGVSGYYLYDSITTQPDTIVAAQAEITVTATPSPTATVTPTAPATPTPMPTSTPTVVAVTPTPEATVEPTPEPTPAPTETPTATTFTWPLKGNVLSQFSVDALAYDVTMADWRTHDAIDIAADLGTEVMAVTAGTVIAIEEHDLMGTTLSIDHGNGLVSSYSNLAAVPKVAVGDTVYTSQVIGTVGNTAIAESNLAPHLHFAMMENGEAIDPLNYLPSLS